MSNEEVKRLVGKIADVFRVYGYEGTSLSLISEATGLKRASLYHYFPNGKVQMAEVVFGQISEHFVNYIISPLLEEGDPTVRLQTMANRLNEFYVGGSMSCLLDVFSVSYISAPMKESIKQALGYWLKCLVSIAMECSIPESLAEKRATDLLIRIQGALVFARACGDTEPFRNVLKELAEALLRDADFPYSAALHTGYKTG